ncbi:hypothetical protein GCM10018793_23620 [Streptomyces sulfonofaciens]|uniref:Uncharacterized protein n=1 Tax=Streptomyces sulfonofaciens TaxID=68272 RepID=A0A919G391_9ACTN|nr:hypothetical protein GCM10018793_23620 [Streptomyces sulfonofaciens]
MPVHLAGTGRARRRVRSSPAASANGVRELRGEEFGIVALLLTGESDYSPCRLGAGGISSWENLAYRFFERNLIGAAAKLSVFRHDLESKRLH